MLGTSGDDEFIWILLRELHGVSNHIAPQTRRSRDNQCIILVHFHFFQAVDAGILFTYIFQWDELIEYTVVDHQQHGRIIRIVLRTEIPFGGIVCFYIMHFG